MVVPVLYIENLFPWPDEEKESHAHFVSRVKELRMAASWRIFREQRVAKERVNR